MITYVSERSSKKGTVNPNKLMPFILNEGGQYISLGTFYFNDPWLLVKLVIKGLLTLMGLRFGSL